MTVTRFLGSCLLAAILAAPVLAHAEDLGEPTGFFGIEFAQPLPPEVIIPQDDPRLDRHNYLQSAPLLVWRASM